MITGDFVNGLHLMQGLSTDNKPTATSENTFFLEQNTGKVYYFSGGSWTQAGDDVALIISAILGGGRDLPVVTDSDDGKVLGVENGAWGLVDSSVDPTAIADAVTDWLDENITEPTEPVVDSSLTVEGAAADAKAVGQALADVITEDIKTALLSLAANCAYANDDGQSVYDALESALYPETHLVSITASYDQDHPILDTDSLDLVRLDLVVTANYSDGTSETLADDAYTLTGTLVAPSSTITVGYEGKTDTIEVIVTQGDTRVLLYSWDFKQSLTDSVGGKEFELSSSNSGTSPTRDSSGLHFTDGAQIASCTLPTFKTADGRSYEFDISSAVFGGDNSKHKRFFNFGSNINVAIFRGTQGLTAYNGAWKTTTAATGQTLPTSMNDFSGKTFKIVAKEDKSLEYYLDNVLVGTCSNWTSASYDHTIIRIGGNNTGTASDGNQIYNCTITGMRIYTKEGGES